MKVINKGTVVNQQNVDKGAAGYFCPNGNIDISKSEKMEEIRSIIEDNCTLQQREALLPVISELYQSISEGKEVASKSSIWIERINKAAAGLGSISAISNAAWWPALIEGIKNLIQSL